ncbi:MAG: winged helix-turn-helix transcriptional regulator [Deltaproteobacteria bacterium]|nr:winged helix-turn-helix transcriptional regulator [Deltaproteobacteria bacterium]
MNIKDSRTTQSSDDYHSLLLLDEISRNNEITQRDLSKRLGIALGLINSYIKNLASKGYITVAAIPKKRYKYYLTPQGFIEKTRMTYHHLQNFTSLYRVAGHDFQKLFYNLRKDNIKRVVFCGSDEVAEIAYITLQEFEIELIAVVDTENESKSFLGQSIRPIEDLNIIDYDRVIITSFSKEEELYIKLVEAGVLFEKILSRGKV